jgi:hypothetical protein
MNKYITLFGSLIMFLVFVATAGTTLNFPTDTNIIISVVLLGLSILGFYKYLTAGKIKKSNKEEEYTPVID